MVGIPRSSGCRICVQRRVRCDGTRPICNNCKKGNRPCPGYGPAVKFQDEGRKLREKYQKQQSTPAQNYPELDDDTFTLIPQSNTRNIYSDSEDPPSWNILGIDIEPGKVGKRMNVFGFVEGKTDAYQGLDLLAAMMKQNPFVATTKDNSLSHQPDPWMLISTPVLSPEVEQLQLLAKFTQNITPPESRFMPKAYRAQSQWLAQLPSYSGSMALLDNAIRAVTLVHIGRIHRDETWVMESRPYYGKALRLLNLAIADTEMGMDNKTLCATILLSFYEMFASSDDASWVRHAGGAGTLMRLRGAKRHRYGLDRDIFLAYRHTLVIEAMSQQIPSFLDEPEWRELSREIYGDLLRNHQIPPERIGVFDVAEEFYSQMAAISVISAKGYKLGIKIRDFGVSKGDDVQPTLQTLQSHHRALQNLMKRWNTNLKRIGLFPPLGRIDDPVFPNQYQYRNVFISSFYVGFWTTLMLVNWTMLPLAEVLGKDTSTILAENEEYAMEACRSVDFMLKSSFLGPFFTIYALRFAYRAFSNLGDIRGDWALCKLIEIGDRRISFAKAAFQGAEPAGSSQSPEELIEGARSRLEEFTLGSQMPVEVGQTDLVHGL